MQPFDEKIHRNSKIVTVIVTVIVIVIVIVLLRYAPRDRHRDLHEVIQTSALQDLTDQTKTHESHSSHVAESQPFEANHRDFAAPNILDVLLDEVPRECDGRMSVLHIVRFDVCFSLGAHF